MKLKFLVIIALLIAGCTPGNRLVKVIEKSQPKTVMVSVTAVIDVLKMVKTPDGFKIIQSTAIGEFVGAGVYVSESGHVLTCAHLFWHNEVLGIKIEQLDGSIVPVDLVVQNDVLDLALLKADLINTPYARLADPRKLRVGQEVFAIGNPLNLPFTVSHGIISALYRDLEDGFNMTQSDTMINPGNSGGPLFNLKGELVGINSRIIPPVDGPICTGISFSVQCGQIIEFLTKARVTSECSLPKFDYKYWEKALHELRLAFN